MTDNGQDYTCAIEATESLAENLERPAKTHGEFPDITARAKAPDHARSIVEQAPEVTPAYLKAREAESVGLPQDSDKFVNYGNEALSPEVHEATPPLYPLHPNSLAVPEHPGVDREQQPGPKETIRRICGLRRKTFWLAIMLVFVIIGGVITGGVLGGILSKRSKDLERATASAGVPAPSTSSNSLSVSASTTLSQPPVEPTPTDYRNIGYNFTIWEDFDFQGRWQYVDKAGYYLFVFKAKSYYWQMGAWTDTEKCSIAYCDGEEWYGWRGGGDWPMTNRSAKSWPDRAKIICGAVFTNPWCVPASSTTTLPILDPTLAPPAPQMTTTTTERSSVISSTVVPVTTNTETALEG